MLTSILTYMVASTIVLIAEPCGLSCLTDRDAEGKMDLTVPVGIVAMLVAVGTVFLILRELFQFLWSGIPVWLRLVFLCALAFGLLIFLSNR